MALREIEETGALLGFQVNLGSVALPVPHAGEVQISDTVQPQSEIVIEIDKENTTQLGDIKKLWPALSEQNIRKSPEVNDKENVIAESSGVARGDMSSPELDEEESNVDAELTCRICLEKQKNTSGIWVHYISKHYMKSLKTEFKDLANFADKTCNVCSKESSSQNALFIHIGVKHEKLDFLLQRDGYPKLPRRRIKAPNNRQDYPTIVTDHPTTVTIDSPKKLQNITHSKIDETTTELDTKINCRLCSIDDLRNKNEYMEHLSSKHYWTELVESFGNKYTKVCILCKAKRNSLQELAVHIGVFHKIAEDYIPQPTEPKSVDILDLTGGHEDKDAKDWESRILENSKKIKETGRKLKRIETHDLDNKRRRGI